MRPYFLLNHYNPDADEKQPKSVLAATQPTQICPTTGVGFSHSKRTYRAKYEKATPLCKRFSTSESAPNTHHTKSTLTTHQKRRAQTNTPIMPQNPARLQKCNPESDTSQRKQGGKNHPWHFNRRQKIRPSRRKQIVICRHAPMQTEYPHRNNAGRSKIAHRSTAKIVSQKA